MVFPPFGFVSAGRYSLRGALRVGLYGSLTATKIDS